MKQTIFAVVLTVCCGLTAICADHLTKEEISKMTPAEKKAAIMAIAHRKYGGPVEKPGTGAGIIKIVNAQKDIAVDELRKLTSTFVERFHYDVRIVDGEDTCITNAVANMAKANANAAVFLVHSGNLPRILVSPEEGWVIVNAAALVDRNSTKEEQQSRLAKEGLRGLFFLGGLGQAAGIPIMHPVAYSVDLDSITNVGVIGDAAKRFSLVLPSFGLEPKVVKNYRTALQEGWAPKPADADQQAIWDEVHALPTEPIKIKPETKKQEK